MFLEIKSRGNYFFLFFEYFKNKRKILFLFLELLRKEIGSFSILERRLKGKYIWNLKKTKEKENVLGFLNNYENEIKRKYLLNFVNYLGNQIKRIYFLKILF